jgi:hypothetical protein
MEIAGATGCESSLSQESGVISWEVRKTQPVSEASSTEKEWSFRLPDFQTSPGHVAGNDCVNKAPEIVENDGLWG